MFATKSAPPPLTPWNPIPPVGTPPVASTPDIAPAVPENTPALAPEPQFTQPAQTGPLEPQAIQHFAPEAQIAPEMPFMNETLETPASDNEPPTQAPPTSH